MKSLSSKGRKFISVLSLSWRIRRHQTGPSFGTSPSDNYNGFALQAFPEQTEMYTKDAKKYQPEDYGDFDSQLFIPHTWGLDIGRGGGRGVKTDNYLHTLVFSGTLGTSPEEGQSFAELNFDVKKYFPILRLPRPAKSSAADARGLSIYTSRFGD